jgi:3-deoxy-D-manno-octulosonate 8-phosphate phosphatase (KDO 8-P phosphatase)
MINWKDVKLLVLDVDGVLTDGSLYYDRRGEALKRFNVRDGLGIRRVGAAGIKIAVISGRYSKISRNRLKELGIDVIYDGVYNKVEALLKVQKRYGGISFDGIAYIGDDVNDIEVMKMVAFPIAVSDSVDAVKQAARIITKSGGGEGAVREICDLILRSKGHGEFGNQLV